MDGNHGLVLFLSLNFVFIHRCMRSLAYFIVKCISFGN